MQRNEHGAGARAYTARLDLSTIDVGGVPFAVSNLDHAVKWLVNVAKTGAPVLSVRLANSYCIALAGTDDRYRQLLVDTGINFPDGAPVAAVMRCIPGRSTSETTRPGRVRGPSLFETTLDRGRDSGLKHFFLGATAETLEQLERALSIKYPGLHIAGTYAPPFAPLSENFISECVTAVQGCSADIVWVGIGTPKQDFLTAELAGKVGKVCVGVGAAFDFAAGTVAEAPVWVQNSGFEWLYRFATEPKRLWRRYLIGNFRFILLVLRHELPTLLRFRQKHLKS